MDARTDRFPLVDALRAIAAIAVVGTHTAFFAGAYAQGTDLGLWLARLDAGVAVFFVVSGFLLYRPFVKAHLDDRPAPATGPYAWRRFLRLAPAYWVALTGAVVLLDLPGVFTADGVATYYGFAQTYREHTIGGGLTPAWSLSVEVAFYVFLPVWAAAVARVARGDRAARARAHALGIAGLAVIALAWNVFLVAGTDAVRVTPWLLALPAYWDHFAVGMGLALLTVWLEDRPQRGALLRLLDRAPGLSWLVAGAAYVVVSTQVGVGQVFFGPTTGGDYLLRHLLYAVIGAGLVAPAVLGSPGRGAVRRVLAWRPLAWLGLVSYGIFLWHTTGLSLLHRWGLADLDVGHPYVRWAVFGVGFGIVLGAASYYLVERPALRLKRLVRSPTPVAEAEGLSEPAPAVVSRAG